MCCRRVSNKYCNIPADTTAVLLFKDSYIPRSLETITSQSTERSKQGKGKGKANPLQALTGPERSRRLRLPDFKTVGT
jgi:hypothetical protein